MYRKTATTVPVTARQQQAESLSLSVVIDWIKKHLFNDILNSLITLSIIVILISFIPYALDWLIISAVFTGETRADCTPNKACWIPIIQYMEYYIYGPYPDDQKWRVDVGYILGGLAFPLLFTRRIPKKIVLTYVFFLPVALWMLLKGGGLLTEMPSSAFGGIMLTFFLGAIAMCLSMPVAILLALGRQSKLPIIRWICVGYIETIRAVPILTFLIMASLMLQIFLPDGMEIEKLLRVLFVLVSVSAAYKAEIIRGGIQAIPKGQAEAAYALGAGYWTTMVYVIMPQALRNSVPALITNFIGLFKETTLVAIVGILELVGVVRASFENAEWIGFHVEGLVLVSFFFFTVCYSIALYGGYLERGLKKNKQ